MEQNKKENEPIKMFACGCEWALPVLSNYPAATAAVINASSTASRGTPRMHTGSLMYFQQIPTGHQRVSLHFELVLPAGVGEWSGSHCIRLSGHCFIRSGSEVYGQSKQKDHRDAACMMPRIFKSVFGKHKGFFCLLQAGVPPFTLSNAGVP